MYTFWYHVSLGFLCPDTETNQEQSWHLYKSHVFNWLSHWDFRCQPWRIETNVCIHRAYGVDWSVWCQLPHGWPICLSILPYIPPITCVPDEECISLPSSLTAQWLHAISPPSAALNITPELGIKHGGSALMLTSQHKTSSLLVRVAVKDLSASSQSLGSSFHRPKSWCFCYISC